MRKSDSRPLSVLIEAFSIVKGDPFSVRKRRGTAARYAAPTAAKCTRGFLGMLPERPRASAASASAAARPWNLTKNDQISPKKIEEPPANYAAFLVGVLFFCGFFKDESPCYAAFLEKYRTEIASFRW